LKRNILKDNFNRGLQSEDHSYDRYDGQDQTAVQVAPKSTFHLEAGRTPAEAKIKVSDLHVSFGEQEILHGITAGFPTNQITALLGPTGSGKTTLLRTFNRLNELVPGFHYSGAITLDGEDIYRDIPDVREVRRRIGMLFQRPNPFPQSIEENIAIGLRAHNIVPRNQVRQEVERQLVEVGLWDAVRNKLNQSPFELSGGQQQLLCLARTLAVRPEVILLDEPTSSLDPVSTQRVEDLLDRIKERLTIIVVTHNISQAARISDYVVFLNQGELIEANTSREIFYKTENKITEDFLSGRMG
jgi:phosphate transport system ATP-binding protein